MFIYRFERAESPELVHAVLLMYGGCCYWYCLPNSVDEPQTMVMSASLWNAFPDVSWDLWSLDEASVRPGGGRIHLDYEKKVRL